jgi:hypothetical protein
MTDTALFRKSLNEYFSRNYTKVAVYLQARDNNYTYGSIGISPSVSKLVQYKRFMVEPYLKMNFTFFDIGNSAIISCTDLNTNQHVEKELYFQQQNLKLVPAMGTWAAIKFAKVVYFTSKIEFGYNVSNQKINIHTRYTNNEIETIPIHFPRSYIIGSIGLHLIPFNRISKKEYAKWSPAKMKRFENSL